MNWLANLLALTELTTLLVSALLAVVLLLSLVLPYFPLRRSAGAKGDAQLGLKVLLQFCFSVCTLLFLLGVTIVVRGLFEDFSSARGAGGLGRGTYPYEVGGYLAGAALILAGMYLASLHYGTDERLCPAVGRFYTFWRFAVHNLVIITAVCLLAVTVAEPPPNRQPFYNEYMTRQWVLMATLLIWGPSWLVHLWLVWKETTVPGQPAAALSWDVQDSTGQRNGEPAK